jgi:hypothetical protein
MKRSRFTEEQILFALKQADAGQPVADGSATATSGCSRCASCGSCATRTHGSSVLWPI